MDSLGRFPLSVILSFLKETEGTSLLITQRHYAKKILPLFKLPPRYSNNNDIIAVTSRRKKNRHRFVVCPIQDPQILLERLNTRRLCRRHQGTMPNAFSQTYRTQMTTRELAVYEWAHYSQEPKKPPSLELLRFDKLAGLEYQAVLTSYPRSGNTLMRTLLEKITGIVTGSDTRPDRTLSRALAQTHNLVGEGVVAQSSVSIVKTHFPERTGYQAYQANCAVVLVRNPFDAIDSYWNLCATNTHTETVTDEVYERLGDKFNSLARNEMKIWIQFHQYWLNKDVPILMVRFEDLIADTKREMCRVLEFLMVKPVNEEWRKRINHTCGGSIATASLGSYRPRSIASGGNAIGKSIEKGRYTHDLLRCLHNIAEQEGKGILQKFGYDVYKQDFPNNFRQGKGVPVLGNKPADPTLKRGQEKSIQVNASPELRSSHDAYGRAMTKWRHGLTDKDKKPFPTVRYNGNNKK